KVLFRAYCKCASKMCQSGLALVWNTENRLRSVMFKWILVVFIVLCSLSMVGCQQRLFDQQANMTPYRRYQQLHGGQAYTSNNRWGMTPQQLRQRLQPLGQ